MSQDNTLQTQAAAQKLTRMLSYLAQDPQNEHILLEVIDLSLQLGHVASAREHVQQARSLFPDSLQFRQREGNLLMAEENWFAAKAVLQAIYSQPAHRGDPVLAANLAYCEFWLGQYAAAKELLQPLLNLPDVSLTLVKLMMRCLHQLGEIGAALDLQQAYAARMGQDAEFAGISSLLYFDDNQLQRALDLARDALAAERVPLEALVVSATLALGEGELALAHAQYQQVLAQKPQDGRSRAGLGLLAMLAQDYAGASEQLAQAIEAMPQHIGTRHILGWCKILSRDLPGARLVFQDALAMDRNFAESHGGMAVVAALSGQREEAESAIRRAQGLNPEGMAARFAKMLLADQLTPGTLQTEVAAALAAQRAPMGGSLTEVMQKMAHTVH